jgi:hypothetical protein
MSIDAKKLRYIDDDNSFAIVDVSFDLRRGEISVVEQGSNVTYF